LADPLAKIQSAIDQYGSSNPWGADSDEDVNSINQNTASGLTSTLNLLKQKISDSLNSYNQQSAAIPAQFQPEYNQHANQAALALRNVLEAAANRGDNGGMQQLDQLSVNTSQQNADAQTDSSKNAAMQKITDAINQLYSGADTELGTDIATANQNRIANISSLKSSEAEQAEKQYEAQLAAQAKIQAAQIGASGGAKQVASPTVNGVLKDAAGIYGKTSTDSNGNQTIAISNPDALLNYIQNSGLSYDDQDKVISQIPYSTSGGQSLLSYLQNKVNGNNTQQYTSSGGSNGRAGYYAARGYTGSTM
jgi:hypothetical protein